MVKYIHYGASEYNCDEVTKKRHSVKSKPDHGLWASRVDAKFGWKDWCEAEDFRTESFGQHFEFTLSDSAKILEVHSLDDVRPYAISDSTVCIHSQSPLMFDNLDFNTLYNEFDGIELFLSDDYRLGLGVFQLWDCDSIVVWNPEVIQEV